MYIFDNHSVYTLPGQGEQTNDKCGQWTHPLSCPNYGQITLDGHKHDRYVVQHSCHNPNCPICYESWASRLSGTAADRIIQAMGLYHRAGIMLKQVRHFMFSPPQAWAIDLIKTKEGAKQLRTEAIKIAKKAGVRGAAMIFHPFRQNDPRENSFKEDMPPWVWYESPHFHFVGEGWLKPSDVFYAATGWVYENIGRRETIHTSSVKPTIPL